ncbi:MAG: methyl-accepting chemotaxis protein [Kiritimatiellae bacterium]|nr:methyl-accepting chemotaxis protein [Kiritimatiellia bacterium]
MQLTLKHKIVWLAVLAAALPVVVMSLLILTQKQDLMTDIINDMNAISKNDTGQIAKLVHRVCEMANRRTERRLREHEEAAWAELEAQGPITFDTNQIAWVARNQFTQQTTNVSLPLVMLGALALTPNTDFKAQSPVVDVVTKFAQCYCTIFQRMNEEGDMLRVATTVPAADGKRAIGTFIARHTAQGEETPVLATVFKGETYVGRARVLDQWHAAAYRPIWDSPARKRVVGMLYVGFNMDKINQELRAAILSIVVAKTGYVWVLGGKGEQRGHYIISKGGESDGVDIWNSKDPDGHFFIQEIIAKSMETTNGSIAYARYPWQNKGEPVPRMKLAAVTYFPAWDWVIGASMYEDDYHSVLVQLDAAVDRLLLVGPLGGVIVMLLAIGLALLIGTAIAKPINKIIAVAKVIAEGNLAEAGQAIDAMQPAMQRKTKDEPSQLFAAVATMTQRLASLVGQVQRSSVQLVSTATEIAAASRQQEAAVTEFGASTTEVTAAVKEISATSQELVRTMQDVKTVSAETEDLADTGRAGLTGMEGSMRQLAEATTAISSRLAVINEKANAINSMVTTITKVADQTNLLSLNAAIEAEKAGEYGLGFSVVAREIRRLADQTAVASLEIDQTVREMQTSVTAGVMEMDKFTSEVTQGVSAVSEIGVQMGRIIEQVKVLTPRFESVNEGMQAQSSGARQISEAMSQLSEGARKTSESLRQFNEATEQLKEAARGLQQEAARFKV